jgi:chromosome segregation ATPase
VSVGLGTASAQSKSSKVSQGHATVARLKSELAKVDSSQDQSGQLLTRALADLDHCQNQGRIKDAEIKALKETITNLRGQIAAEQAQIEELKKAIASGDKVDTLQEERNQAQEKRIALYKQIADVLEEEVNRLTRSLRRAAFWGNVKMVLGFVAGVGIGVGIGSVLK